MSENVIWVWTFWATGLTISTLLGSWLVRKHRDTLGYPALLTLYVTYIITSNILASRISEFNILSPMLLPGGIITFPFVAQLIDMINEIYGKRLTYNAILLAFLANAMVSMFIFMLSTVPPAPWLIDMDKAWQFFLLQTPRIVIASYTAFIIAELLDATIFAEIKRLVYKYEVNLRNALIGVLLRSAGSDVLNMVTDSLVFFPLAFAFTVTWEVLWQLTWHGTYVKILISLLDTPWFIAFRLLTKHVRREY
jgi:uncharacterized integral membrane protein (TIGR00697 family)